MKPNSKKSSVRTSVRKSRSSIRKSGSAVHKSLHASDQEKLVSPPTDPNHRIGKDIFTFWNKDYYIGQYSARASKTLIRQGPGKYYTEDGSTYNGDWVADILTTASPITFQDGCSFVGQLNDSKYHGVGHYLIPGVGELRAYFSLNKIVGPVELDDVCKNEWNGVATRNGITLFPKNHFMLCQF